MIPAVALLAMFAPPAPATPPPPVVATVVAPASPAAASPGAPGPVTTVPRAPAATTPTTTTTTTTTTPAGVVHYSGFSCVVTITGPYPATYAAGPANANGSCAAYPGSIPEPVTASYYPPGTP